MVIRHVASVIAASILIAALVVGCGALSSPPASKIVPISGFDTIFGEWEGLSKGVPDMREHARVLLTVSEKGHFNFASDRAAGLVLGSGALYIQDCIVFGRSSAGTGMFTLHDHAGKRVLVVDAALNDGNHYFIEMTPIVKKGRSAAMEYRPWCRVYPVVDCYSPARNHCVLVAWMGLPNSFWGRVRFPIDA